MSTAGVLAAILIAAPSCGRWRRISAGHQRTFATPEDAGTAVAAAARSGDRARLIAIFGPHSSEVLFTGNEATDKTRLYDFVNAYGQMHRWSRIKAGAQVLQVGAGNYPFPIPLARNSAGRWYFDTAAGRDEILARRIGKNELTAMDALQAIASAEEQYAHQTHDGAKGRQYAQKLVSDPGKHNGLYWSVTDGETPSPLGGMNDFTQMLASASGEQPLMFNGYYYRMLPGGGGKGANAFTVLAYPTEYRNSGIVSFLVGEDGTVYQKDLGEKTGEIAAAVSDFHPADGWTPATTTTGSAARMQ